MGSSTELSTLAPNPSDVADAAQLLTDHHLVLVGDDARARNQFAVTLTDHLTALPDVQVIRIDGRSPCGADLLSARLGGELREVPDETFNLVRLVEGLRRPPVGVRRQYFVWTDADELIQQDAVLFGRLVDAVRTVATEGEYVGPGPLVIQRLVLVGGASLASFVERIHRAEEREAARNVWADDGVDGSPLLTLQLSAQLA